MLQVKNALLTREVTFKDFCVKAILHLYIRKILSLIMNQHFKFFFYHQNFGVYRISFLLGYLLSVNKQPDDKYFLLYH